MADKMAIAKVVGVISAAYPNFNPTPQTVDVYYQTLRDIPEEELQAATLHCITEPGRKFAPSVGELRGAIVELRSMSNNVPSSFEAWQEVLQQFNLTGSYGDPKFSHPLIDRAVQSLGWRELCLSENQTADRARFIQCYEQLLSRVEREESLLPEVRGYIEVRGARLLSPAEQIKQLVDKKRSLQ